MALARAHHPAAATVAPLTRKATIGGTVAILAAIAVVVALAGGPARDTAGDAVALVELRDDPPFRIALGGPLWQDRTLRDEDAQDFALVRPTSRW